MEHKIQPIGYSPIGSPSRPERDRTDEDIVDMQIPEIINIAQKYKVHPATICLRWAMQKGIIPIPFSVKEYQIKDNLNLTKLIELTSEEMKAIQSVDKNCRLIKGQVFLWENATSWEALWDIDGTQDSWEVE